MYVYIYIYIYIYICMYVCRFQYVVLRCPTPRLHRFLSSHRPWCRFLSFMAFLIRSFQFLFGLPCALFCFGIHLNAILGNLSSAILWTWPYHVRWFCSISFIIGSSNPMCCLIVTFIIPLICLSNKSIKRLSGLLVPSKPWEHFPRLVRSFTHVTQLMWGVKLYLGHPIDTQNKAHDIC